MKILQTYLLHTVIVVSATLSVSAMVIISLYYGLSQLINTGVITDINLSKVHTSFLLTSIIAITATVFISVLASFIYFRITQPWQQRAETFHILAKTAHESIFLIDIHGIIQFANPAAEMLFGYQANELAGKNIKLLMPSPHSELHDKYIKDYLKSGIKKVIGKSRQLLGQRKDGSQFPMYISIGEVRLKHIHLFAGLILDLSTQQKLQREILAIPAREQQRIGEELHDGLGQQLTGLSMLAQSLLNNSSAEEHKLARQLATGLHDALTQVRALSRGLVPVQIYADGFMISLQEITQTIEQQSHIPINLKIDDKVLLFDDATATHLYRIVQESLNNAIKHADASQIDVTLKIEQDHGVLEIIDNGIGIPTDLRGSNGLGLNIMKHRCGLFNGEISINPGDEHGTKVCCRFPITSREPVNG